jgi:uncharacterized damage-inducible protein DinB
MAGRAIDPDVRVETPARSFEASLLRQAVTLLESLPDGVYTRTSPFTPGGTVGRHLRHCVDFFERFFDGVPTGRVDYSARRRDPAVETSRAAALSRFEGLEERLAATVGLDPGRSILVRPEDDDSDPRDPRAWSRSSIGRELRFLASHTLHHFALIAVLLRTLGHRIDPEFGVAPSTLRHRSQAARTVHAG